MWDAIKRFFANLFGSPVFAKAAITQIIDNNPRYAKKLTSAANVMAKMEAMRSVTFDAFAYYLKAKSRYDYMQPAEQLMVDAVLEALRDTVPEVFDARPLLGWLGKQ